MLAARRRPRGRGREARALRPRGRGRPEPADRRCWRRPAPRRSTGGSRCDAPDIAPLAALGARRGDAARSTPTSPSAPPTVGQGVAVTRDGARASPSGANRIGALDAEATHHRRARPAAGRRDADGARPRARRHRRRLAQRPGRARRRRPACASRPMRRLAIGTLADLSGELTRLDDGFAATLDSLDLRQQGVAATLTAPATVTLRRAARSSSRRSALDFGTRQPDGPGARSTRAFDIDVAMRDPAARHRQRHPPRPRPRRHRQRHRARHRAARRARRALRRIAPPASARPTTRSAGLPPVALEATRHHRERPPGAALQRRGDRPRGHGERDGAARAGRSRPRHRPAVLPAGAGRPGRRQPRAARHRLRHGRGPPDRSPTRRSPSTCAARASPPTCWPPTRCRRFALTAAGSYRARRWSSAPARATGAGGLDLQGSGRIPFAGPGLDASVYGHAAARRWPTRSSPTRSAQAAGELRVTATARGSLAAPQLARHRRARRAARSSTPRPTSACRTSRSTRGSTATPPCCESFRAEAASGGTITAQGRVALRAAASPPT